MNYYLPKTVDICGKEYKIRNDCDFRIILEIIELLNDDEIDEESRVRGSLFIFLEDCEDLPDLILARDEMMNIINRGQTPTEEEKSKPKTIDWVHDYDMLCSAVSAVLGYSIRDEKNYTHWYDFLGAFREISDKSYFSQVLSVRTKLSKGKKLDKSEEEFYRENKKDIILSQKLTKEEQEWLNGF